MRQYKMNWDKIKLYLIIAVFAAFGLYVSSTVIKIKSTNYLGQITVDYYSILSPIEKTKEKTF